ncbi:hypothetical protein GCM10010466_59490 [Planomonospora alba]|uniref:Uncharacterized protein n=1 Tax=Planomonospora alba TaxID=161354 RepID=A0ABP6NXA6_9ACTN
MALLSLQDRPGSLSLRTVAFHMDAARDPPRRACRKGRGGTPAVCSGRRATRDGDRPSRRDDNERGMRDSSRAAGFGAARLPARGAGPEPSGPEPRGPCRARPESRWRGERGGMVMYIEHMSDIRVPALRRAGRGAATAESTSGGGA